MSDFAYSMYKNKKKNTNFVVSCCQWDFANKHCRFCIFFRIELLPIFSELSKTKLGNFEKSFSFWSKSSLFRTCFGVLFDGTENYCHLNDKTELKFIQPLGIGSLIYVQYIKKKLTL